MSFDEVVFRGNVDKAIDEIRTILDTTRNPKLADEVPHNYDDKYLLCEFLTNGAISAILNAFEVLGLNAEGIFRALALCACWRAQMTTRSAGEASRVGDEANSDAPVHIRRELQLYSRSNAKS